MTRTCVHLGMGWALVAGDLDAAGTGAGPDVPVGAGRLVEALDRDRAAAGASGIDLVRTLGDVSLDVARTALRVDLVRRLAEHQLDLPGSGPGHHPPSGRGRGRD